MKKVPFSIELFKANPNARVVNRQGAPRRVFAVDFKDQNGQPVLAELVGGIAAKFSENGSYHMTGTATDHDLFIEVEPKLRAWKPEEVPVGALFRFKHQPNLVSVILMRWNHGFTHSDASRIHMVGFDQALDRSEHSTDGGRTWKPCGIEE